MKILKNLLINTILFFMLTINVNAASASLSVNKSSVENGGTVTATATLSGTAAWNISINSTGATAGCSEKFADATSDGNNTTKYLTVTCKATSVGIINFSLSGDITSSDGVNTKVSGSKSVKVVKPREKSTNNNLQSLSVEEYEISPKFNSKTKEYSVSVPNTVDKIKIIATKADSYASLSGDGEKEVEEGANLFEIIVTSETGVANLYKLTVNVDDLNPIEVKVDNEKYTLVKNPKKLVKPDLFTETTVTIDGNEIPAFINENTKCTLVGLKDESGKIKLFIYKDGEYSLYNEYKTNNIYVMFLKMEKVPRFYQKYKLMINESYVDAYKLNGDSKILVYGQNIESGEKNYYTYDRKEKTLQIFDLRLYDEMVETNQNNTYYIYGLTLGLVFLFMLNMLLLSKNKKQKKLIGLIKDKVSVPVEKKEEIKIEKKSRKKDIPEEVQEDKTESEIEKIIEEDNVTDDFWDEPKRKRKKK